MKNLVSRRQFLKLASFLGLGGVAYTYWRGLRFPPLSLEPAALPDSVVIDDAQIFIKDLLATPKQAGVQVNFRAFAPQPSMRIIAQGGANLRFSISNLASDAILQWGDGAVVKEQVYETVRHIEIHAQTTKEISLSWKLPHQDEYQFAAIGDTGGGRELEWCLIRAHQLGAKFLLHLGDLNYQSGDYESAIALFNSAPLPCYVSIGNHDFHDSGLVYDRFRSHIGPLNQQFSIGPTRFVNFDTAASFLPYSAGQRGKLFDALREEKALYSDTVAFTHRPLYDPNTDGAHTGDHDIGNEGERDWLIQSLKEANINSLLSGHIHVSHRSDVNGIDNIIAGQGLGHQDLLVQRDHSKMLIGRVSKNKPVLYEFAPLAMPLEMHCHPRSEAVKQTLRGGESDDYIRQVDAACEGSRAAG